MEAEHIVNGKQRSNNIMCAMITVTLYSSVLVIQQALNRSRSVSSRVFCFAYVTMIVSRSARHAAVF